MGRPPSDKRERLVDAAVTRFHHRGIASSSLADIARAAGIAPGNVYYHFATKDALAAAVVETWSIRIDAYLGEFASLADPWQRLRAFVERAEGRRDGYSSFGCPLAALGRDLRGGPLARDAARPLAMQQRWLADQFVMTGIAARTAAGHAHFLLATLQGSFALAHASGDNAVIAAAAEHLLTWLADVQATR